MKLIPLILFFLLCLPQSGQAHPPGGIQPQYDKTNGTLVLTISHLSKEKFDHYIDRVTVIKNQNAPMTQTPRIQPHPNALTIEFSLSLEEGDQVYIKTECREGGEKELLWDITKEVLEAEFIPAQKRSAKAPAVTRDPSKAKAAVPDDPDISKSPHPKDKDKYSAAYTLDPDVAKSPHPTETDKYKPAVTRDSKSAVSAVPTQNTNTLPAVPNKRTIQKKSY